MALDLETRNQLIETVRRFVTERLRPIEAQVAENDAVPDEIVAEMRELGLFGLTIPTEYGGLGLNMEEEVLVGIELGGASPAFRSAFGTNVGIGKDHTLFALVEGHVQFAVKGPLNKHTVSITAAA